MYSLKCFNSKPRYFRDDLYFHIIISRITSFLSGDQIVTVGNRTLNV